jgi:hypothetical protein
LFLIFQKTSITPLHGKWDGLILFQKISYLGQSDFCSTNFADQRTLTQFNDCCIGWNGRGPSRRTENLEKSVLLSKLYLDIHRTKSNWLFYLKSSLPIMLSIFLQILLAIQGILPFHINFVINLLVSKK